MVKKNKKTIVATMLLTLLLTSENGFAFVRQKEAASYKNIEQYSSAPPYPQFMPHPSSQSQAEKHWLPPQEATQNMTLREAIFLALRYNKDIQSSELDRVTQKFDLRVAENAFELQYALKGSLNTTRTKSLGSLSHAQGYNLTPSIKLKTATGTEISLSADNNNDGIYYNPTVSFSISQPLTKGANPDVVLAPLRNQYDEEIANKISLRSGIIDEVVAIINDYRSVVTLEQSLKIQKEAIKREKKNVENTRALIKAGERPKMDITQAKLSVAVSKLQITIQSNGLQQAKQNLLLTIGLNPHRPITIVDELNSEHFNIPTVKDSLRVALRNDPVYQQDLLTLREDKRNILVQKDAQHWDLSANVTATWGGAIGSGFPDNNFIGITNGRNTSQTLGLSLTVPINDLSLQEQLVTAEIQLKKQALQTQFDKHNVETRVINEIRTLKTNLQTLDETKETLELQRVILKNAYLQFHAGQIDMLSVTQQQTRLTLAENAVLTARIAYLNSITDFNQILQWTLKRWDIKIEY